VGMENCLVYKIVDKTSKPQGLDVLLVSYEAWN
jgi:hypothetical protein